MNYKKNLLNELRLAVISDEKAPLTEENLVKAVTLNENLKSLGYRLRPDDIVKMAENASVDTFFDDFRTLVSDVEANPMYPDFPSQVMNIDEAQFRFHQLVHYFSTYGMEDIFDVEMKRGWLPDVKKTKKTESDETLIDAKTLGLIEEKDMFLFPYKAILSKRERMSIPEKRIVAEALRNLKAGEIESVKVAFKENLFEIFVFIMEEDLAREEKIRTLHLMLQHSGDVWKCFDYYLGKVKRYSLATSQKKTVVRLLESYPAADFRANLVLSRKKAARILKLLEFLSYSRFSKSPEHMKAVDDLRDAKLRSWHSKVRRMLEERDSEAVRFISERSGILLRMMNELLKDGFDSEEIKDLLLANADKLSTNTLVKVATHFSRPFEGVYEDRERVIYPILLEVIRKNLSLKNTPLKGKKLFIEESDISLENSVLSKSEEGGYLRQGMAVKIPERAKYVRFFTYWNDKRRIDIDLHAYAKLEGGDFRHIGWNADFRAGGRKPVIVSSGDITHSDAAEYIDVKMDSPVEYVEFFIYSYTGVPFSKIETVFTGMMAVRKTGTRVKLYDPKNCFFTHDLKGNYARMIYGYLDLKKRLLVLEMENRDDRFALKKAPYRKSRDFTIMKYLELLAQEQGATITRRKKDADLILKVAKAENDREISLSDRNFFLD